MAGQLLKIKIKDLNNAEILASIKNILANSQGSSKVIFYVPKGGDWQVIETGFKVDNGEDLRKELKKVVGEECVK